MAANSDFKIIKEKRIDKETTLKVTKNLMSGRIFVEFRSDSPRIVLQKNFEGSLYGKLESEKFYKSIKSTQELREYFGIKKKQ